MLNERLAVAAVSLLAAPFYAVAAVRTSGCAEQSVAARYTVAAVALAIVVLCSAGTIAPVVAYGVLCLTLVSVNLVDLSMQERARRRRVASLVRRPVASAVAIVWIGTAAAASIILAPYVVLDEQRIAALLVDLCVLATAAIAWRVATAPEQLAGTPVRAARLHDRMLRDVRCGVAAVLAIGSIMVFIDFENAELAAVLPLQQTLHLVSQTVWATVAITVIVWWMWRAWQLHRLRRAACPTDP